MSQHREINGSLADRIAACGGRHSDQIVRRWRSYGRLELLVARRLGESCVAGKLKRRRARKMIS
jgi:hypothetical protein